MNGKTAKTLKNKALEFSRSVYGREHFVTKEKAYSLLKDEWIKTPRNKKDKFL